MRLHRFYIEGQELARKSPAERLSLDSFYQDSLKALIHQWRDVFRYTVGSQVVLFDDSKTESLALIESITNTRAEVVILDILKTGETENEIVGEEKAGKKAKKDKKIEKSGKGTKSGKSDKTASKVISKKTSKEIWLFASIIKGDNFEWVAQKTTELGVDHIVPIISDRTIKKNINTDRLKKIIIEAAEQSGRVSVPVLHNAVSLKEGIDTYLSEQAGRVLLCVQGGKSISAITDSIKSDTLALVIGPEGGWSEKEIKYFETLEKDNKGVVQKVALGENILRAETAAVVVMALIKIR